MIKGTNTTFTIKLPMQIETIENMRWVMAQDITLIKELKDMTVDEDYNKVSFGLTLDEVNSFTSNKSIKAFLRVKLKNGVYLRSRKYSIPVEPSEDEGAF